MADFHELKYAFSHEHLTVAAWCMDGVRVKYTFKVHPSNQYFFDKNVVEGILHKEGFTHWAWDGTKPVLYVPTGCRKRFYMIRSVLQNRVAFFEVFLIVTAAVILLIHFR